MAVHSTLTATAVDEDLTLDTTSCFPPNLPPHILQLFQKLDQAQAGHIRHFHNLATQLDGEWRHSKWAFEQNLHLVIHIPPSSGLAPDALCDGEKGTE